MERGLLVAIEGIDGSGKTTVALSLVKALTRLGYKTVYTRELFSSPFTSSLTEYVEWHDTEPTIEVLAIASDRAHHIAKVVMPLIEKGFIVVMDRYIYSSIAYQGASGADLNWIETVNNFAPPPDIAIYLDVPLEIALRRIPHNSPRRLRYFEYVDRLRKALEIYRMLVRRGVLISVDATQSIDRVVSSCLHIVLGRLGSS